MGFDTHYPNRKDWRKPYRKAQRVDHSCRPNGSCDYCKSNRLYQYKKELSKINQKLSELY